MNANNAPVMRARNPYVGLRPYETGEKLYGRDSEIRELKNLLMANRIVLLTSPPKLGKTSLIRAGLIPELDNMQVRVLRVESLGNDLPPTYEGVPGINRFVLSTLLGLGSVLPSDQSTDSKDLLSMTLAGFLDRRHVSLSSSEDQTTHNEPKFEILIFDHFEAILTRDPDDVAAKRAFFAQLGVALTKRHRWALFAISDSYVSRLTPYIQSMPVEANTRFELKALDAEAARSAIEGPAHSAGVKFSEDAVQVLIDYLQWIHSGKDAGDDALAKRQVDLYVDPSELQRVCSRLWERRRNSPEIRAVDVNRVTRTQLKAPVYWPLWLLAIAFGVGLSLGQQFLQQTQTQDPLEWLSVIGWRLVQAPITVLAAVLPWVILCILPILGIWLYRRSDIWSHPNTIRLIYLLAWGLGSATLANVNANSPALLGPQGADIVLLSAIWSTILLTFYAYLGDRSEWYQDHIVPYRGVWIVIGLISIATSLTNYSARLGMLLGSTDEPTFLLISLAYLVLVSLPSLLMILFVYRRRRPRSAQIVEDLLQLDPTEGLLKSALSRAMFYPTLQTQNPPPTSADVELQTGRKLGEYLSERKRELHTDVVAARMFGISEYIGGSMMLWILLLAGWYYIFYLPSGPLVAFRLLPGPASGLSYSSVLRALGPLAIGFIGSYIFIIQTLIQRYLADDLYPSVFFRAGQRLLLVLASGLGLAIVIASISRASDPLGELGIDAIMLFIGIVPTWILTQLSEVITRLIRRGAVPKAVSGSVTNLAGVTARTRQRLLEEHIRSITNVATLPIERLVLGTPFPAGDIVDWVDQAILYVHAGLHRDWFSRVGIRGAMDLLNASGFSLRSSDLPSGGNFAPKRDELQRIVVAIHKAQPFGSAAQRQDQIWAAAHKLLTQWLPSADAAASVATGLRYVVQPLTSASSEDLASLTAYESREAITYLSLLRKEVQVAAGATAVANFAATTTIEQTSELLHHTDATRQLADATEKTRSGLKSALDLADRITGLIAAPQSLVADPSKEQDLKKLDTARVLLPKWLAILRSVEPSAQTIVTIAGELLGANDSSHDALILTRLRQAADKVAATNELAQSIDATGNATLDLWLQIQDLVQLIQTVLVPVSKLSKLQELSKKIYPTNPVNQLIIRSFDEVIGLLARLDSRLSDARSELRTKVPDFSYSQRLFLDCCDYVEKLRESIITALKAIESHPNAFQFTSRVTADEIYAISKSISTTKNLAYVLNYYRSGLPTQTKSSESIDGVPNEEVRFRRSDTS